MYHVRTTKTASKATAVQIVTYSGRTTNVVLHIGSAHTPEEIKKLRLIANNWIEQEKLKHQLPLFPLQAKHPAQMTTMDQCEYVETTYSFLYESLQKVFRIFSFPSVSDKLLLDLVIIRIVRPSSKLASLTLLAKLFGITYTRGHLYEAISAFASLKDAVEEKVISLAQKYFSFDFSMVFYDVTTLYYESFTEDEDTIDRQGNVTAKGIRRTGFSKDNKHNQPQILIGLMVNKDGFPVAYEVFEGNTFEGDTFIPIIWQFKKRYKVETLTVVADAAMISFDNVEKLKEKQLAYIVGARIGNLTKPQMTKIRQDLIGEMTNEEELKKKDKLSIRIDTDRGILVCDFSYTRYLKDRRDLEKKITRAENLVEKNTEGTRTKFLMLKKDKKKRKEKVYMLNTELIEKTKLLLGIKGYYTNLFEKDQKITNQDIIDRYHNLWHVEKAFRIDKSDLQMRPIYHFKKQAVEAHVLICFMALAVSTYIELVTKKSIQKVISLFESVNEANMRNAVTGEMFVMRKKPTEEVVEICRDLGI